MTEMMWHGRGKRVVIQQEGSGGNPVYSTTVRACRCDQCAEDSLVEAVALHRAENDSGRRYSLDELAAGSGIDLDELRREVAEEESGD